MLCGLTKPQLLPQDAILPVDHQEFRESRRRKAVTSPVLWRFVPQSEGCPKCLKVWKTRETLESNASSD
jgi:hypothetical protein